MDFSDLETRGEQNPDGIPKGSKSQVLLQYNSLFKFNMSLSYYKVLGFMQNVRTALS